MQLFRICLICVNLRITPLCGRVREVDTLECGQIAEVSPDSYAVSQCRGRVRGDIDEPAPLF